MGGNYRRLRDFKHIPDTLRGQVSQIDNEAEAIAFDDSFSIHNLFTKRIWGLYALGVFCWGYKRSSFHFGSTCSSVNLKQLRGLGKLLVSLQLFRSGQ